MPRVGDKKYVCSEHLTKGDLPSKITRLIDQGTAVPVSVAATIVGVFVNTLVGATLANVSLALLIDDAIELNIAKTFSTFASTLEGKPDTTPVYVALEFKYTRKGSQGYFWVPTQKVKCSTNDDDFIHVD